MFLRGGGVADFNPPQQKKKMLSVNLFGLSLSLSLSLPPSLNDSSPRFQARANAAASRGEQLQKKVWAMHGEVAAAHIHLASAASAIATLERMVFLAVTRDPRAQDGSELLAHFSEQARQHRFGHEDDRRSNADGGDLQEEIANLRSVNHVLKEQVTRLEHEKESLRREVSALERALEERDELHMELEKKAEKVRVPKLEKIAYDF